MTAMTEGRVSVDRNRHTIPTTYDRKLVRAHLDAVCGAPLQTVIAELSRAAKGSEDRPGSAEAKRYLNYVTTATDTLSGIARELAGDEL